ncbi:MAG: SURF1 family protein [Leptothrix sp. (in: b-proteobacteria)]
MVAEYPTPLADARRVRRRALVVLVAALLLCALTARLGVWQLDRADQKRQFQAQIVQRHTLPALPATELARDAAALPAQVDRTVQLTGRWLAAGTVFLDNRQMNARPGFYVVTPLLLGPGDAIMVQRGWVPRDQVDRQRLPELPSTDGDVHISGRIAPPPSRLYDFGDAGQGLIRQNLDLAAHAKSLGLTLRPASVVQTDPVSPADGPLLRDWPVPAVDIQKHLGYAAQWFALSALCAGLYVWFQLIRPRLRRDATQPA